MNTTANNLPIQLSSFIGREREIAEVKRLLAESLLVTLTGAGGCGKTALALHVCRDGSTSRLYGDGVCWVELAPLADAALVPQAIVKALGIVEQPNRTLTDTLLDYLRDKEVLLVLDNCEHLIEACAQLATQLLQGCPDLRILATSCEALNIAGEVAWMVPSLQTPNPKDQIPISSLQEFDAVRLFVDRASAMQLNFQLTEHNVNAVAQICQRLDGIPLAIELAAARVKVLSVEQIAARLDDALRLLTEGKRSAPQRHQTLRATLDWSYDQLAMAEQILFRRLAVFAGGFTLAAAEEVCTDDDLKRDAVLMVLLHLIDKSLVLKHEQEGASRYRLLEPIRQYAHEQLKEAREAEAFSQKHLEFYMQFAEEAEPKLIGFEQMTSLKRLDAEHDNLRAAIDWAGRNDKAEAGLRLVTALRWFWDLLGYWLEAKSILAVMRARPLLTPTTPHMIRLYGRATFMQGIFSSMSARGEAAEPLLNDAITLAQSVADQQTISEAILWKGWNAFWHGDHTTARAHIEDSLARAQAIGDTHLAATILDSRGYYAFIRGELIGARADLEEGLRLARALGDKFRIAWCLSTLGIIAFARGDYADAYALNVESLSIARELGLRRQIRMVQQRLGQIAFIEGDVARAQLLYDDTMRLCREMGERGSMAHMLNLMSNLKRVTGDYGNARPLADEGLQVAKEAGEKLEEAHALAALGRVALGQGDYTTARARFEQSLTIRQQISNKLDMPAALHDLGDLALCQDDLALAHDYYEQALSVSREIGNQASVSVALRMLGYLALEHGDATRALQLLKEGLTLNQQRQFRLGMIRYLPAVAALALARDDVPRAARLLATADALLDALHVRLEPADARACQRSVERVRAQLDASTGSARGQATFNQAWSEGRAWTLEQAIVEAEPLLTEPVAAPIASALARDPNALTARELDVLRLVAAGLTDAQIAERLVISRRTVSTHLTAIYSKLGVNSRAAATRHALDHQLI